MLAGRGRYADDIHVEGMLHAALFRSSRPHGRIRHIDITMAGALPGVAGVFTYQDFAAHLKPIRSRIAAMPGFEKFLQLPLATDKVRYVGEPMAVAVATSPHIAEDAVSLISAEIDELPVILNWKAAERASPLIHEFSRYQYLERRGWPRRCRYSISGGTIRSAGDFQRAAPYRGPDGDARAGG